MRRRLPLPRAMRAAIAALVGVAALGIAAPAASAYTLPAPKADLVADAGNGCVIAGDNVHQGLHTASIAKVMTALTAVERLPLNAPITVDARAAAVEPNKWGFPAGTVWPLDKMLVPLMMISSNDAAYAIANTVGHGDFGAFANDLNATAKDLGMKDSLLNDPAGLDDPGYGGGPYMSAFDLANATRNALTVPAIAQWAGMHSYTWTDPSGGTQTTVNHNKMLPGGAYAYAGATGFKTGFTDRANHTLLATATRNGRTLIAVILGAADSGYAEAAALLDQGFAAPPTTNCPLGTLPPLKVSLYGTRLSDQASFARLGGGGGGSASGEQASATPRITSDVPAQIQTASPPRAATPTRTTIVAANHSHGIFSMRNVLILLILAGITTFFLRRRAVRRQRARRAAQRRQRMAAIRSGGLPVVDGRYRAGLRLGQPIESNVRVRRGDDIAGA